MGWLNQDDIKPYKRLFKQQETKGSLMGRGLNPPVKYKDKQYCNWYCAKKK